MSAASFVSRLARFDQINVFNPYADICADHDKDDAPAIRRANLRKVLDAAICARADSIWIGRDLGYRGGRRTGLALTDEAHLDRAQRMLGCDTLTRATKGMAVAERTATVIWNMLDRIQRPTMLWNVFPFHPHAPNEPMTNRSHTRGERELTVSFLVELVELLHPSRIVAIGADAATSARSLGFEVTHVRHPSYGGQTEFVRQVEALYEL